MNCGSTFPRIRGGDPSFTRAALLANFFAICEEAFDDGQELLTPVTELTISYGAYFRHNKELLFYERKKEIIAELGNLDL